MRHFDAWLLRDPYSIFHYYSTGRRWQETVRDLIQERKICSPPSPGENDDATIDPYARPLHPQSTCAFLQRLPLEIRLLIYQYVFGQDVVVHLVQLKGQIRHVRCHETRSSLARNRRCCPVTPARWRIHDQPASSSLSPSPHSRLSQGKPPQPGAHRTDAVLYPHSHAQLPNNLSNSSPALLRTCRAIYAEAADLLYRDRVFDVDDLHTFIAFSRAISPSSRRAINRLTVHWMPIFPPLMNPDNPASAAASASIFTHTHNDHLWSLFWSRVASLPNIKELLLAIDLGRFTAANFTHPLPPTTTTTTTTPTTPATAGGTLLTPRLRLSIDEPWVTPLLAIRGIQHFDLAITARCDPVAKRLLEPELCKEAGTLRDHLRAVLCAEPDPDPLPLFQTLPKAVREILEAAAAAEAGAGAGASSWAGRDGRRGEGKMGRRRLAITAA
ncbi:hypothetical protein P168DRAFT_275476 [Aspergillus campestris IBT 28561]|uniref:DUF7730 domain-containing protein n=1 Tax=Aspergillus campestris (strain IBT 28561) TaxID=1392248 RepID=A0A2I1CTG1_ASPC2|nr:uncharacterized protein P168DRAFT_275476 [Aspergillus campestris IBT 28561]PKY00901.1 hypothetical protein P168DRAFT_275476 [Aspergillus campestris IBT 28561]